MNESYALITGSSSGIGLEIAYYLAEKGFNLILTARREGLLKNTTELIIIFILGTSTFVLFELFGPKVWLISFFMCFIYYFWMRKISSIV